MNPSTSDAAEAARTADCYTPRQRSENSAANRNDAVLVSALFVTACDLAGIPPTRRQASKWNNGRGLAWDKRFEAKKALASVA